MQYISEVKEKEREIRREKFQEILALVGGASTTICCSLVM